MMTQEQLYVIKAQNRIDFYKIAKRQLDEEIQKLKQINTKNLPEELRKKIENILEGIK